MAKIAVLTRDDSYKAELLDNGFAKIEGKDKIFSSEMETNIAKDIQLAQGRVWMFGMNIDEINIYYQNGRHRSDFSYGWRKSTNQSLADFIVIADSKRLRKLCDEDIKNQQIIKDNGDFINPNSDFYHSDEEYEIDFEEWSTLKEELMNLVDLANRDSASVGDLPEYVDNLIVMYR